MTIAIINTGATTSIRSIGPQYYRDGVNLLMRPGRFFEALPTAKTQRDILLFLGLTALIHSVLATLFVTANRPMYFVLYSLNALLLPVVTALVLHLLFRVFSPGRFAYGTLLGVTAYANGVLLLAWIPGIAPWAELLKYVWIGLGLVKIGGISGLKASGAMVATGAILIVVVYLLQYAMRF